MARRQTSDCTEPAISKETLKHTTCVYAVSPHLASAGGYILNTCGHKARGPSRNAVVLALPWFSILPNAAR